MEVHVEAERRELQRVEPRVLLAPGHQLVVRAQLDDVPVREDRDPIGVADGREPVRDDEGRPAFHQEAQAVLDHGLVLNLRLSPRTVIMLRPTSSSSPINPSTAAAIAMIIGKNRE